MEYYEKIQSIFKNGKKFTIIEMGCAATVANSLMSVPGASSFIDACYQPYSKQQQEKLLEHSLSIRSVSVNMIEAVFNCPKFEQDNLLVLSFQLQDPVTNSLAHGWIGIKTGEVKHYYHVSFNKSFKGKEGEYDYEDKILYSRQSLLEEISRIAIEITYKHTVDSKFKLTSNRIDFISTKPVLECNNEIFDLLGQEYKDGKDNFVVFKPDGTWERMEDFMRASKGVILMRGSFNPIHQGHIELLERSKEKYPEYNPAFLISVNNFDKPPLTKTQCLERFSMLQRFGIPIIFSSNPLFNNSLSELRNRWIQPIIMPVGIDTVNRFITEQNKNEIELYKSISNFNWKNKKIDSEDLPEKTDEEILNIGKPSIFIFFKEAWKKSKFLVFHRQGYELIDYKRFKSIIEVDYSYTDPDAISSTKIRNGEIKNTLEI